MGSELGPLLFVLRMPLCEKIRGLPEEVKRSSEHCRTNRTIP